MLPAPAVRALALLLAAVATACATPDPAPSATAPPVVPIDHLHERMAAVVEAQRDAEPALSETMTVTREIEALVAAFRTPATVDDARGRLSAVEARAEAVDVERLRPPIHAIAFAVDDARAALAEARGDLPDPTDRAYLDAEDEVLQAVRAYAEAADALAQVLEGEWPTHTAVLARSRAFVDGPEVYRSPQEASDAYEVRIHDLLDDLRDASSRIADFQDDRQAAARAVNAASAVAAERWRQRDPVEPSVAP